MKSDNFTSTGLFQRGLYFYFVTSSLRLIPLCRSTRCGGPRQTHRQHARALGRGLSSLKLLASTWMNSLRANVLENTNLTNGQTSSWKGTCYRNIETIKNNPALICKLKRGHPSCHAAVVNVKLTRAQSCDTANLKRIGTCCTSLTLWVEKIPLGLFTSHVLRPADRCCSAWTWDIWTASCTSRLAAWPLTGCDTSSLSLELLLLLPASPPRKTWRIFLRWRRWVNDAIMEEWSIDMFTCPGPHKRSTVRA